MTYSALELSQQDGAPVELLKFSYGGLDFYYTSAEEDYTYAANEYISESIQIDAVESSQDRVRNNLRITVQRDNEVALLFRVRPPSKVVAITYTRVQREDGDLEAVTPFVGRVLNAEWTPKGVILICEPISSSQKRNGNVRKYSKGCGAVLYECGVNVASFQSATIVDTVTGFNLAVAAVNMAYNYAGGFISWVDGDGIEQLRSIESNTGVTLTLDFPFISIPIGAAVTIAPGCNHTLTDCQGTFGNGLNYPGFPKFPTKNPFDGTPIY